MQHEPQKIKQEFTHKKAYVYVRQSTMAQIQEHQESTKRQYELYQRALQLGWTDSQIEIIVRLGHRCVSRRVGTKSYKQVVTGEVGAFSAWKYPAVVRVTVVECALQNSVGSSRLSGPFVLGLSTSVQ
ncbi:hypothetical protein [Candidatus Villigracilis saccharophilus]|uniref:hypothetical protein n=1 Tax=Candidatus Villigracilis saccharophilus TaxID=3140684 RepID=UPI003135C930|nr:hypothetical protein [Anaerolineales bacterium]